MGGFEVRLLESVLTEKYRELKHPIKRINMTSERMRQMLPAHEEQFLVKAREGDVRASRDFDGNCSKLEHDPVIAFWRIRTGNVSARTAHNHLLPRK